MSVFGMMDDWVRVARMPWSLFTSGLDFMWRISLPPGYYERYGAISNLDDSWRQGPEGSRGWREGRSRERNEGERRSQGGWRRSDEPDDLSGDDVKLVRYKLLYIKRGQEKVLDTGEELVSYNTDSSSYSGRLIARYLVENSMPEDEHRYLKVNLRVLSRFPKEDVDYDGRMVDLMQRQVEILGQIERRVQTAGEGRKAA